MLKTSGISALLYTQSTSSSKPFPIPHAAIALLRWPTTDMLMQFSVQNTTTWCGLSTHPLLDFGKKAQSRIIWIGAGAPSAIACNGPFSVALTVSPRDEDTPSNPFHNFASAFIPQETAEKGSLSTHTDEDTALRAREESAKEVVEKKTAQESHTSLDRGSMRTDAKGKDHPSLEVPKNARRKHGNHPNKGKVPWNKGRKHSEETKQRIRARTREAMDDPMLRERLRIKAKGSALSSETKLKIRTAITNVWDARRKVHKMQESCAVEWKEMIADAARRGSDGDVVYQWDSYATILGELRATWKELQRRRAMTRNKSADHRTKIAEAIKAKWADPNYRESVHNGLHAYLSNRGAQPEEKSSRPTFKRANGTEQSGISLLDDDDLKLNPAKKASRAYMDPLTQNKLEKLKRMRASRLSVEEKKQTELTERARVLMAEANRAANSLEAAAAKDKNAIAPLLESRRLLAEAARSFETAGLGSYGLTAALLEVEGFEEILNNDSPSTGPGSETKNSQREVSSTPPLNGEDLHSMKSQLRVSSTRAACYFRSTVDVRNPMQHYMWRSGHRIPLYSGNEFKVW